ncbi:hypothetical protein [Desulfacinum infernum]|jgi:arginine repressor|uniref:hypothetical protein n=1 Tax=Desulfacinum infernum TaxID=35837 RepID=UPI0011604202|nr:hypothetical protein [Desulfacinum infernum]
MTESQQKILQVLEKRGAPATVRQVARDLRRLGIRATQHGTLGDLRSLAKQDAVGCEKGLWSVKSASNLRIAPIPDSRLSEAALHKRSFNGARQ